VSCSVVFADAETMRVLFAAGIIRVVKENQRNTDKQLDQAFADLNSLMANAQEIVSAFWGLFLEAHEMRLLA
jgi:hypothetical protein